MANAVPYGFHTLADVKGMRVAEVGVEVITRAVDESIAAYNKEIDDFLSVFASRTTEHTLRYQTAAARRLQPLDEYGRPRPTRGVGFYDVAFPLMAAGDTFGATFEARETMTVDEVQTWVSTTFAADRAWLIEKILATLLVKTEYTWVDPLKGSLVVKPLANADAVTYLNRTGSSATAQHYLAQTAIIADATNPFPIIRARLAEKAENSGPFVSFIPDGVRSATEGLATFHRAADPNIRAGLSSDTLIGTLNAEVPGEVIGYEDSGIWISVSESLPANNLLGLALGGARPLAWREHVVPSLRGFRRVAERPDHPFYESIYERRAGFGALNRVGAVAYQVSNGDTVFDSVSGYAELRVA